MKNKIDELRQMATDLLADGNTGDSAFKRWGENVRDLLQELSVYDFELEHQNAALEQSERELAKSRQMFVELFEDAPLGYVIIDRNMVIVKANKTFEDMFMPPYPRDVPIVGKKIADFVSPQYRDVFEKFCAMLLKKGAILPIELKMDNCYGNSCFVTITAGKRNSTDENFRLAIVDIDMRKKLELQLLSEKEKAEGNDYKKTMFLTEISHELRTPLEIVSGYGQMLSDPNLDAETRQNYLDSVLDATRYMQTLADGIIDISLINGGSLPLQKVNCDIEKICRESAFIATQRLQKQNLKIDCKFDNVPVLLSDSARFKTLVHSVLKYVVCNIGEGTVDIRASYNYNGDEDGTLILEFSSKNIFAQSNNSDANPNDGSNVQNCEGIGLFLAKQILKAMNGRFLQSRDFIRLEIPMQKSTSLQDCATKSVKIEIPNNGFKTCLLVDDVMMNLKVLAALMRKLDYVPLIANSAKEALQILSRTNVDLIMTDLWMPEINGMEFAMTVRQMPSYDKIPIVAVTADVERTQNFDMRYFADTLIKPVGLEILREKFGNTKS